MTFITTIPVNQASGEIKTMYQHLQGDNEFLPNYAKVFCYRPEVMESWAVLQKSIRKTIDFQSYELVTLAAAAAMNNSYCSLAHGKKLLDSGFNHQELKAIIEKDGEGVLSSRQQKMVRLARKVATSSSQITQQDIDDLKAEQVTDAEIFDIVASAAARCFFGKIADSLGALPDAVFRNLEPEVREVLTVGRAISSESTGNGHPPEKNSENQKTTIVNTLASTA
jgi:uncharacterized peroxidase-related enzyme